MLRLLRAVLDAGADRVGLADTVGYADPLQVRELFERSCAIAGDKLACGHFHDTRGLGIANVFAALAGGHRAASTPAWPASAAARTRPARAATSPPKTSRTCSPAWASTTGLDFDALIALRAQDRAMAGRRDAARHAVARRPAEDDAGGVTALHAVQRDPGEPQPHAGNAPQPLEGLRVVEFTHMVMGPTCGMVLADLGAEVIKVEPVDGEGTRRLLGAGAGFFPMFNRNKKSIGIDLQAGRKAPRSRGSLAASADVVVENFKPGALDKFGLDYASLSQRNDAPDLRQPQGLPARPVRAPHRARRGRADDGRPRLHDRPPGRPAARRHQRQRHHGRAVRRHRRAGRADPAAASPARGWKCSRRCSRTTCS